MPNRVKNKGKLRSVYGYNSKEIHFKQRVLSWHTSFRRRAQTESVSNSFIIWQEMLLLAWSPNINSKMVAEALWKSFSSSLEGLASSLPNVLPAAKTKIKRKIKFCWFIFFLDSNLFVFTSWTARSSSTQSYSFKTFSIRLLYSSYHSSLLVFLINKFEIRLY